MDTSFTFFLDGSDEPQIADRSPSRLDFCMADLEECDDASTRVMDWACTPSCDGCSLICIDEDASSVDIALLDNSPLSIPNSPHATGSQNHENKDISHTLPLVPPQHPTVTIEPQAPIPVRPPSVQLQSDAQEHTPPFRTVAQRLNYPHHGFSRSALLQQKTFWYSRHEEWAEWQSRMEQSEVHKQEALANDAYTGLVTVESHVVTPPYMRTSPSGLERDLADHPPRKHEQDIRSSIHPRVGDILALRDPYSVNVDRCFFRYPLWTLQKALYVFNMNQRPALLAPSYNTVQFQASMCSPGSSSYTSSTSADDDESDSTLVDSPVAKVQVPSMSLKSTSSPHSRPSWSNFCGWELSWYTRWELLICLFQHDHTKCDALEMSVKSTPPLESKEALSLPPTSLFRSTVGVDEENNEDDEDYGRFISNSSFHLDFEEECDRALAFYSRESTCLEMAL